MRYKGFFFELSLAALMGLAAVESVSADVLSGNGSFQSWSAGMLGTAASPTTGGSYWNNTSGEGGARNIGWCLAGGGNCAFSSPGAWNYYGNGTSAASEMTFSSGGTSEAATLSGVFTNQNGSVNGVDYFGWYQLKSDGTIGSLNPLFSAENPLGTMATFTPTGNYGFYILNVQSAGQPYTASYYWTMNNALNFVTGTGVLDSGVQHFSVFTQGSGSYYLGAEDTPGPTSDLDYNDLIVHVQAVPEPVSVALFAAGLCFLGLRMKQKA